MDTNMATVADKVVTEITQLVQQTSPEVWKILMRQVVIEGYESLAAAAVLTGVTVIGTSFFFWGLRKIREADANSKYVDTDPYYATAIASGIGSVIAFVAAYCNAVSAFEYLANPAYQAARLLLNHLHN